MIRRTLAESGLDPIGTIGPFDAFAFFDKLAGHADAPAFAFDDFEGVLTGELSGSECAGFVDDEEDGALLKNGAGSAGKEPVAGSGAGIVRLGLNGERFGGDESASGEGDSFQGGATVLVVHSVCMLDDGDWILLLGLRREVNTGVRDGQAGVFYGT